MLYKKYYCLTSNSRQKKNIPRSATKVLLSTLLAFPLLGISISHLSSANATSHQTQSSNTTDVDSVKNDALNNGPLNNGPLNNGPLNNSAVEDIGVKNREILVIHSYHSNMSWTQALKAGIDGGFQSEITIHHEYLDAKRYPKLLHQKEFLDHIKTKYKDTRLSVLMVSDDPGTDLVMASRDDYFPDIPIVFMGVNNVQAELLNKPWLTGVFETHSDVETILEAVHHNKADTAIVVSDSTSTGQRTLHSIQENLRRENDPPKLIVVEDLVSSEIARELGAYPDHWPIFLAGQLRRESKEGALISFDQEALVIQEQVANPTYINSIMRIGYGAIGGKILDGHYHAEQAVELAQQILSGTPVNNIDPILKAKNQWVFDAQALEAAHIDTDVLPAESVLINVQPTFYSQYRYLVGGFVTFCAFSIIIITVLSYAINRQKRAERLLKENEQQLENRVVERTTELSETLEKLQQTQAQLIQTEKMSSLGQLVGGVAHELNNPLSFFSGNVTCLEQYFQDVFGLLHQYEEAFTPTANILEHREDIDIDYLEKDSPQVFRSIHSGANRIQKIVSSLQAFSRADEVGEKSTDINQSLESTFNILSTQISEDIEIHKNYGILPDIICNPGEMNQVFLSILVNSIEAMKAEENCLKQLFISTLIHADQSVRIIIKDTGPGIPQNIQTKVFDPFFTTKPIGEGTGLGLSLAYQTVDKHQGKISLCSDGQNGTEFMIDLPIT